MILGDNSNEKAAPAPSHQNFLLLRRMFFSSFIDIFIFTPFQFISPLIRFSFICLSLSYRSIHPYSLHPPIYPSTLLFYLSLLIFFFSFFFLFFLFFFFIFLFIFYLFFFSFLHQHFGHSPYSSIRQSVHTSCWFSHFFGWQR